MFFFSQKRTISEDDLVDLRGKVAIVTGANTGIGYATAQFLVRKGAKVYIAARNESKALEAIEKLKAENIGDAGGSLEWHHLDLSDPRLAKKSAEEFGRREGRVDILVNNAAIAARGPYTVDKDGLLDIVVTNYISHYVFTRTLLPLLKKTAAEPNSDVRIVNVSSIAHSEVHPTSFKSKADISNDYGTGFYKYVQTYALTKLQNILHIAELQRTLDSQDARITCMATHPGYIMTRGTSTFLDGIPLASILKPVLTSTVFVPWRDGAMNIVWAAAGKDVALDKEMYRGRYVEPVGRVVSGSVEARDERLARELWTTTEGMLNEMGV
ncbi:NAD-P-binding protein [Panaeolus papilionaceus]|nr:NAD-P-binding protein [Panaeolus papilionaceus]